MSAPAASYRPPVDQPPPTAVAELPYGGFWVRFAAHFVDGFIIGIGMMLIAFAWVLAFGMQPAPVANDMVGFVMLAVGQIYHAYFVSSARMATPGKRLCGLYVTDLEGHRLSFGGHCGATSLRCSATDAVHRLLMADSPSASRRAHKIAARWCIGTRQFRRHRARMSWCCSSA